MSLTRVFTRQINARQVGMVRIALGFAAVLEAPEAYEMLRALHARAGVVQAAESWWPQLPAGADNLLALLWVVSGTAFCAGLFARVGGATLTALMAYHIGRDQNLHLNHVYLLTLLVFLLLFADPARGLSVQSLMGRRSETVAYWPIWLMKVQVAIVYVTASVNKVLYESFMSGSIMFEGFHLGPIERVPAMGPVIAWIVVGWELFLAIGLWIPRLRGTALAAGFAFHAGIWLTAPPSIYVLPLFVFAITMWATYLLHVPAERESLGLSEDLGHWRRWDWMGVFRAEPEPGAATPATARRALSVLPVGYLWAALTPDWILRKSCRLPLAQP